MSASTEPTIFELNNFTNAFLIIVLVMHKKNWQYPFLYLIPLMAAGVSP